MGQPLHPRRSQALFASPWPLREAVQILRGGADVKFHGAVGAGETEAAVHVPIGEPTASQGGAPVR